MKYELVQLQRVVALEGLFHAPPEACFVGGVRHGASVGHGSGVSGRSEFEGVGGEFEVRLPQAEFGPRVDSSELHAQFFHDPRGGAVFRAGNGEQTAQALLVPGKDEHAPGSFRREALPPVLGRQPPADFHVVRGSEGLHSAQAGHTGYGVQAECAQAEAVLGQVARLPREEFIDLFLGPGTPVGDVAHHARIRGQAREARPVGRFPGPDPGVLRSQSERHGWAAPQAIQWRSETHAVSRCPSALRASCARTSSRVYAAWSDA